MSVSVVSEVFGLGEGPHWEPTTGSLYFVDIPDCQVHRLNPETKKSEEVVQFDKTVSFAIPYEGDPKKVIVGHGLQIGKLDVSTSKVDKVLTLEAKEVRTRINDGKCDVKGRLWFGTMPANLEDGRPEDAGDLYSYGKKLQQHVGKVGLSNGIGWTGDNRTMFYIDSLPARKVYAFDFDAEEGTVKNQRTVVNFNTAPGLKDMGVPDGMTVDTEDKLWVCTFGGGHILRIDPEKGAVIEKVKIPATNVTSCCFGGDNYDELYVTTASIRLSDDQKKNEPYAGSVFRVSNLSAKGRAAYTYHE